MKLILAEVGGLFSAAESYGRSSAVIEIILMLLVAFVLGYLLRFFLGKRKDKGCKELEEKYSELEAEYQKIKKGHREIASSTPRPEPISSSPMSTPLTSPTSILSSSASPEPTVTPGTKRNDDLTKIEGVGPKIQEILNKGGINSFEDLSELSGAKIKQMLEEAGPGFKMHDPSTWPDQAKMAFEGKWERLKEYQDSLKGGK